MSTSIKCQNCGETIEITQALKQELSSNISREYEQKIAQIEFQHQKDREVIEKEAIERTKKAAIEDVRKQYDLKIQMTKDESDMMKKQYDTLQSQFVELNKTLREEKLRISQMESEYQKKLLEEQDNLIQKAKLDAQEEMRLKMAEKDKKIDQYQNQVLELNRRLEQGSQQMQGEVMELELENTLRAQFPFDEISEVPKGIKGADITQIVRNPNGIECGSIVWEIKNTKAWSANWIVKLKEDQRELKADLAVIVSSVLPENVQNFGLIDGVWVCDIKSAIGLATAMRLQLINLQTAKIANQGREKKAEIVYNYLTSNEFKQRIEVWIEYFKSKREELDKERRYFTKKWQNEEKSIQRVMENTAGIYGDLQGLIGNALPQIKSLELPE